MRHALMLAIVLGQASGNLAYAGQDGDTQTRVTGASLRAATGSSSASTVKAAPALSFEGAQDDKIVRGQIGVQYRHFTLTAGATTSVTKGAGERPSTLADLDGLRNKTTGEVSLYGSHWLGQGECPNTVLAAPCDQYAEETGKKEGTDFKCRLGWFAKDRSAAGRRAYDTIWARRDPRRAPRGFSAALGTRTRPTSCRLKSSSSSEAAMPWLPKSIVTSPMASLGSRFPSMSCKTRTVV